MRILSHSIAWTISVLTNNNDWALEIFRGIITKNNNPLCFITALKITSKAIIQICSSQKTNYIPFSGKFGQGSPLLIKSYVFRVCVYVMTYMREIYRMLVRPTKCGLVEGYPLTLILIKWKRFNQKSSKCKANTVSQQLNSSWLLPVCCLSVYQFLIKFA